METEDLFKNTMPTILCCMCGISIQNNPSNMCIDCLRNSVDITENIVRQLTMHHCRSCNRFLCPPWQKVELESKELMSACLRKIPGLNSLKLVDAVWIWTEPHSMRLKIKLTVQKEVMNGAILQQAVVVEFVLRNQQCKDCESSFADSGGWHAVVQIRQRVSHKRTFFYLEQVLLKHKAHADAINIVTFRDGMDFYFMDRQQGVRFIDFLQSHVPIKVKQSRKLVSADHSSNVGNFKNNYFVEIIPICKDDLVILPKELAKNLSDISPLTLIKAVGAGIHIIDPLTSERNEINTEKYWRYEFSAVMTGRQLVPFIVLSVDPIIQTVRPSAKKRGNSKKSRMAECIIVRESDFGVVDTQFTVITHLGHILKEGDTALGYDLTTASWTNDREYLQKMKSDIPDVILVRKRYPTKGERFWQLRNIEVDNDLTMATNKDEEMNRDDYEDFLQEIEGDKEMRLNINIYKNNQVMSKKEKRKLKLKSNSTMDTVSVSDVVVKTDSQSIVGMIDDDEEAIQLDELLEELELNDQIDESVILTNEQVTNTPIVDIQSNGFNLSDVNMKEFKFI